MEGYTFKLVSRRETLLGTVTVPLHWASMLLRRDGWPEVRFNYFPDKRHGFLRDWGREPDTSVCHSIATLRYHDWTPFGRAVELWGITPEQFEELEGCSFAPSAAYIRSLLEGK